MRKAFIVFSTTGSARLQEIKKIEEEGTVIVIFYIKYEKLYYAFKSNTVFFGKTFTVIVVSKFVVALAYRKYELTLYCKLLLI